uniref:Uncharacterized protein n=1 Tax=Physcomitrium patens TaxID=3218 RepID=A9S3Q4_PHYPA|nr:hypothetical protein PHYPA_016523 [Physcomitrium patens]
MRGDLKSTAINPSNEHFGHTWFIGLVRDLFFDSLKLVWNPSALLHTIAFFNYSTRAGFKIAVTAKPQNLQLRVKQQRLEFTQEKIDRSIAAVWNKYKPAKVQTFIWQINSGGLTTGSWCEVMDFPATCSGCNREVNETLEHCLSVWTAYDLVWKTLNCPPIRAWRELLTYTSRHTRRHKGMSSQYEALLPTLDVLQVAILWHLWCARCRLVFSQERINAHLICHLAWGETIFARMADRNHILSSIDRCGETRKTKCITNFQYTWCYQDVFCSGVLFSTRWHLAPTLIHLPTCIWDPD